MKAYGLPRKKYLEVPDLVDIRLRYFMCFTQLFFKKAEFCKILNVL